MWYLWLKHVKTSFKKSVSFKRLEADETHSMLSGVPVKEHGRSISPPLSANTTSLTLRWPQTRCVQRHKHKLWQEEGKERMDSPAAIWILQPDSSWILVICSPPLPITGAGDQTHLHNSQLLLLQMSKACFYDKQLLLRQTKGSGLLHRTSCDVRTQMKMFYAEGMV